MATTVLATIAERLRREGRLQIDARRSPGAAPAERPMSLRCAYVDLDGTLLGRDGSLMDDGSGGVTLEGARAVQACLRADVELTILSGRRRQPVARGGAPVRAGFLHL